MYMSVNNQQQLDESNRFTIRRIISDNSDNKHQWAKWFAWRPVTLTRTGERVWLEYIYRRALYKTYATWDEYQKYEYGTIICVLMLPPDPGKQ
jgi:hypothetical protein